MRWIKQLPFFQLFAAATFLAFMGLMAFVTIVAYARPSGQTGLDMGKIQKMRYESKT
jgi:hypothetical protein